uniref:Uncharacterized protein n=1 Tax=Strigamia maritima TaxID=126957 RepID=T1J9L8_STRMM
MYRIIFNFKFCWILFPIVSSISKSLRHLSCLHSTPPSGHLSCLIPFFPASIPLLLPFPYWSSFHSPTGLHSTPLSSFHSPVFIPLPCLHSTPLSSFHSPVFIPLPY